MSFETNKIREMTSITNASQFEIILDCSNCTLRKEWTGVVNYNWLNFGEIVRLFENQTVAGESRTLRECLVLVV